uniref:Putative phenazine biosynthesis-like domain-containing protein 1 n=1 Tax=Davidia involucrata TaxID=16924 RepID=A0A5B7A445_DAVIN
MGKKTVKYRVVDAFTDSPFKGNPAAVCLLEEERDDEWLQAVASEFNLSETCYLTRLTDSASDIQDSSTTTSNPRFRLRWFTPVAEAKFCGHATLAAAHFLFTSGSVNANKIEFLTLSGVLTAKRVLEAQKSVSLNFQKREAQECLSIELDFPVVPIIEFNCDEVSLISEALGGASLVEIKKTTSDDLFVVLSSGKAVADLQPQFDQIQKCPGDDGIIVTALAPPGSGFDFISRYFCPKFGIYEDPVTGSVHCALAPYWCKKLGKCDFVAYQASPRGGILNLHLDEKNQRVLLRGKAITVMEGTLLV